MPKISLLSAQLTVAMLIAGASSAAAQDAIDPKLAAAEQCLISAQIDATEFERGFENLPQEKRKLLVDCMVSAGIGPWDFARASGEPMHRL